MYVRFKITYAGPAWGTQIFATNWKKIEGIQNIAMRTITGLPWCDRNTTIAKSVNITTIKDEIKRPQKDCLTRQQSHISPP